MNYAYCPGCGLKLGGAYAFCPRCGIRLKQESPSPSPSVSASPTDSPAPASRPENRVATPPSVSSVGTNQAQGKGASAAVPMKSVTFRCKETGASIATAEIPSDFLYAGKIRTSAGNDYSQLPDWIRAESPDHRTVLFSESGAFWEEFISQIMKTAGMAGINRANLASLQEPEELLCGYAERFLGLGLRPTSQAVLPGPFAKNRSEELSAFLTTLLTRDGTLPNVQLEILNVTCDPRLLRLAGKKDGRDIVVLAGCEYLGVEYRNAVTPAMLMGGAFGMLGMLAGAASKAKNPPAPGSFPFGQSQSYGLKPDIIRWGYKRLYLCVADLADEARATGIFLRFVDSLRRDTELERRRAQAEDQIFLRAAQKANVMAQQARQNQLMAQQRAIETSRMIARNSAEISAGIMDSWNRKMDADSRISRNWSEAVRGVNTWQTADGRRVEVDVRADHVYQNRYGDVYGVSGTAPDDELLGHLNWTELTR